MKSAALPRFLLLAPPPFAWKSNTILLRQPKDVRRGHSHMHYRPEIDGLRAVAVVPVILFHAGFEVFSGGFVGVDVFFVISGYLITSILIAELEAGNLSILRFYERRARRILPALFTVLLVCLPFAWAWMLPSQMKDFAQSLVAVMFFGSNILFWQEAAYFAPAAELKPLLHTWSLAVEEQYYLLFPPVLLALWRFGRRRVFWAVVAMAGVSLMLSEWGWRNEPSANFYLAPSRAWELLAGSLCAFASVGRAQRSNNLVSGVGLVLIVGSVFAFDAETPFPSLYALAPVGGAVLIVLYAGSTTVVARLLSTAPFVGMGLVSYSAYLWHQPLFAFARIRHVVAPPQAVMMVLAVAAFALAWLTWRYVEQPFRRRSRPLLMRRRSVFLASAAIGAAFGAIGVAGHLTNGLPDRTSPAGTSFALALMDDRLRPNYGLDQACDGAFTLSPKCRTGDAPNVLLWGDSYAMHLAQALVASPSVAGLIQHTKSQCAPIAGLAKVGTVTTWQACMEFNDQVLDWLRADTTVKHVVMSSPFHVTGGTLYLRDGTAVSEGQQDVVVAYLSKTAEMIRAMGKTPIIVSPPPNSGQNIGQCLASTGFYGVAQSACDFAIAALSDQSRRAYALLQRVSSQVPVVWMDRVICDAGRCRASVGSVHIYRDSGHLSVEGSAYLGSRGDLLAGVVKPAS